MYISAEEWTVFATSFAIAARALIRSLPVAVAFVFALSRPAFLGKSLLDGFAHLPLVLPPVLTGFLLLELFGRRGVLGAWLVSGRSACIWLSPPKGRRWRRR